MNGVDRLKYLAKSGVARLLYASGFLQLWQRVALREKAVVLMYHRVLTPDERRQSGSHPALVVDTASFARQMALLKRRFTVLSLEQFADCLERKTPFPDSSCLITFDDGWRDNFTNALPVLAQNELPALVFLPMNYIGRRRVFWQEALTRLLEQAILAVRNDPGRRPRFAGLLDAAGLDGLLDVVDDDPRGRIVAAIGSQKRVERSAVEGLLRSLAGELGVNLEDLAEVDGFVDWQQVQDMSRHRVSFGGHGLEHLLLTHVSAEEADREIRGSKAVVSETLREPVSSFSYPNGYLTSEIVARVRASGYRLAFVTSRGPVTCHDDPFTIRRVNIHETATATMPMFLARLVGLW
jgi:peptidoglycan/xylan/chitin deacetylase (PgdA/CDA1 family)